MNAKTTATLIGRLGLLVIFGAALAACGSPRPARTEAPSCWVPGLIDALKSEDATVRRSAARALGRIGPAAREAVPALTCALLDQDEQVRSSARGALYRIGGAIREPQCGL